MNESVRLVDNIVWDPLLFCRRAGGSCVNFCSSVRWEGGSIYIYLFCSQISFSLLGFELSQVKQSLVRFGKILSSVAKFSQVFRRLAKFTKIYQKKFSQVYPSLAKSSQFYPNLAKLAKFSQV
jgi:hypothetical protein